MLHDIDNPVTCPTCGKVGGWTETNPWRPFCSEHCRLIDLGVWVDGEHKIPGEEDSPWLPESEH
ncbi:MAG: DNA gyrase inhibitor YacG [Gammaproteobacteria bacterium]|nr:DNA gyrase inhibitor YacG [Gammaproteobacteria bacterium]